MKSVAIIGYGEVGRILAKDLRVQGVAVTAFDIKLSAALLEHAALHGVVLAESHGDAVRDADLVLSAVTASQTVPVARDCTSGLRSGAFFSTSIPPPPPPRSLLLAWSTPLVVVMSKAR